MYETYGELPYRDRNDLRDPEWTPRPKHRETPHLVTNELSASPGAAERPDHIERRRCKKM